MSSRGDVSGPGAASLRYFYLEAAKVLSVMIPGLGLEESAIYKHIDARSTVATSRSSPYSRVTSFSNPVQ
jgi:hypothetical protein